MVDLRENASGAQGGGIELPKTAKAAHGEGKKKKNKKKKRKYSAGLEELQRTEAILTDVEKRIARAVLASVRTWESGSKKSARKRRDGALKDVAKNSAKAYAKYAKIVAGVPSSFLPSRKGDWSDVFWF